MNFLKSAVFGAVLAGGAMFFVGRAFAPSATPSAEIHDEHGAESHDEHGEESHDEHGAAEAILFTPTALKSVEIEVAPVQLRAPVGSLVFDGTIETSPDKVARVASVVPGRVTQLFVGVGQKVRRGQTLALIESRGVGEAQSAYSQANARLQNARAGWEITQKQARAGVFARAPLENARRAQIEARAEVLAQENAVRQAQIALENANRLAQSGSFARPALETARERYALALESLNAALASQKSATATIAGAQSELARRGQLAQNGAYGARAVEEAGRAFLAAQAARASAQSEVSTTRANLERARALAGDGLVATRDLEAAQNAFNSAANALKSASASESAAAQESERQQKLAASGAVAGAEIAEAQTKLAQARADERAQKARVARAREVLELAKSNLNRERAVFGAGIANRRELSGAQGVLTSARNARAEARQNFALARSALARETQIFRANLNAQAQLQSARAALTSAQSDFGAAQNALELLKAAPNGSAIVPLKSPLDGIVQTRDIARGEAIEADKNLFVIADLSSVHVDMNIPEGEIARVQVGAPVSVRVDAFPNQIFAGRIELIHSELDPKTRTVEAHAEIFNPGHLRVGMFARAAIVSGSNAPRQIWVPAEAVQDLEGEKVVFVRGEKAGEFHARPIEIGATQGGQTLIKNGLQSGEKVVIKGAFMVKAQAMKAELGHEH